MALRTLARSASSKLGQLLSPLVVGALVEDSIIAMGAFFTCGFALALVCLCAVPKARHAYGGVAG